MADLAPMLLRLGPPNVGMLFGNVLFGDPYDTLMDGVTDCTYAGKEKVNGVEAHHLKFKQPGFDWELYIAAEGKPYVLRMVNNRPEEDAKVTTVETYKNWKIGDSIEKNVFTFTAPKDAKKVNEITPPGPGEKDDKQN
jgi:hypothetical protein